MATLTLANELPASKEVILYLTESAKMKHFSKVFPTVTPCTVAIIEEESTQRILQGTTTINGEELLVYGYNPPVKGVNGGDVWFVKE